MKILFVCTGNTCRSPMAEAVFRKMIKEDGTEELFMCQSAGIAANSGDEAAKHAVSCLKSKGIDISEHRARKLTKEEVLVWDAFFTMTDTHTYILQKAGIPADKIYTSQNVEDPFGKDLSDYIDCRDKIEKEVALFYAKLKFAYGNSKNDRGAYI